MTSRRASWIWSGEGVEGLSPDDHAEPFRIRLFRRRFVLSQRESTPAIVNVSADTWYQLHCNGALVGEGPAKGDVHHHFYDTYDIDEHLHDGENVLAARVIDLSPIKSNPPTLGAQTSFLNYSGGFMLESALPVSTDSSWTVAVERAYRFQNEQQTHGGFVGFFEELAASLISSGWTTAEFEETSGTWEAARELYPAITYEDRRDDETPYGLLPRQIPILPVGEPDGFDRVFQISGAAGEEDWQAVAIGEARTVRSDGGSDGRSVRIPPRSKAHAIVDVGRLTTGFPIIETSGGMGAAIRLTYSEALRLPWDTEGATLLGHKVSHEKLAWGYTDEDRGWTYDARGSAEGFCDIYHPPAGAFRYRPLRFRTFRFIKIEIETADEAVELRRIAHSFTAYPFDVVADFETDDDLLNRYWDTSIRTYRLCCHETFEDCPYYEQMQYAGDSAITSQIAIWTSGDGRLSAQAIRHFDWSRIPDGISQSRYPSSIRQFIPSWSLHWIMMVWDYHQLTGDVALVREVLPGMRAVLDWFRAHSDETGLPARLPYWNNVDWSPDWDRGRPPGWDSGATAVISCQLIVALERYRDLLTRADRPTVLGPVAEAGERRRAAEIDALTSEIDGMRAAAGEAFWDDEKATVRDATTVESTSQYAAAWAILARILPEGAVGKLSARFPDDPEMAPASYFGLYYVVEALCSLGRYRDALRVYDRWREMAEFGLSTWAEETTYWRSLCHAWSAHPALFFLRRVLGARPEAPGFRRLVVEPAPCGLPHASGTVATPKGPVTVAFRIDSGQISVDVSGPDDLEIVVRAPRHDDGGWPDDGVAGRGSVAVTGAFSRR